MWEYKYFSSYEMKMAYILGVKCEVSEQGKASFNWLDKTLTSNKCQVFWPYLSF